MFHGRRLSSRTGVDLIMMRWRTTAIGAAAFLAAHALIVWRWSTLAGVHAQEPAWFANSTGSIILTVLAMATAGFAVARGARRGHERTQNVLGVAAGAVIAMAATMLIVGGGSIAPLAFLMGGSVLVSGAFTGGIIATLFTAPR